MQKTLVLIHGWGTSSYNSQLPTKPPKDAAWNSKKELTSLFENYYNLHFYNLPGFCGTPEPKKHSYDVEDFAADLNSWLQSNKIAPDAILGYSFGGAVALCHKVNFNSKTKIILVSPALKRKETLKSFLAKYLKTITPQIFSKSFKHVYQSVFSKYYNLGTPFLKASYDKIARRDLRPLLTQVKPEEVLLIFGDSDTSTPSTYLKNYTNKDNIKIIKNGDHEIGVTHPREITNQINTFLNT